MHDNPTFFPSWDRVGPLQAGYVTLLLSFLFFFSLLKCYRLFPSVRQKNQIRPVIRVLSPLLTVVIEKNANLVLSFSSFSFLFSPFRDRVSFYLTLS